mmetsp:Transcript_22951/g.58651  ORF Transcript_22951/g.58651 Transcript_22951/m.58651 type:complete len:315 (-) Transcript_22951:284-1228(-)|eukprot:CAMPEP_0202869100 /NCGR_PEP_ID=MMETSP1391-20130828/11841_1 /ASSEMBLY_ACC=CAM_ASM_000867 /TAXON_ID=1034604 /ORGANISM="Chlamydomonas leiostraca, Strain SAG 11-49" /LENGTH=314 /DNA_ID=CAMNT_0049549357 /DNA_START=18 /DNA_END=962 /DNA_ORIENTATION=-
MPRLTTLHRQVDAHDEGIWSAAWIPNSNRLLTGSVDESVKAWDASDALKFEHTYQGHTLGVIAVTVSASGTRAASSALDSVIRVWDLEQHATIALIETASTETWSITFSPATDRLQLATAAGARQGIVLWDVGEEGQETKHTELPLPAASDERSKTRERFVLSVAYSPDGSRLACGAMDGTVAVFDTTTGQSVGVMEGHHKPVRSLAFTPDSRLLLTACDDMHVNLYDVAGGALVESFSGHESWVLAVAPHPSGASFASGGSDGKVKLWDLGARACVQTSADHTDQVWSVAFSSDGNRLVSVSDDKSVTTYSYA